MVRRCTDGFRIVSGISLALAVLFAAVLLFLRLSHRLAPDFVTWKLKSAYPLIFTGIACISFQFSNFRVGRGWLLGLMAGLAFTLWGVEQFLANADLAATLDDLVVALFVVDAAALLVTGLRKRE